MEQWITVLVEEVEEVEVTLWEWLGMEWATVRASVEVIRGPGRDHEETESLRLVLGET